MSSEVPIEPCRCCGEPKRIDTWCATDECAERVAAAQQAERELIFGSVAASVLGSGETE